MQYTLHAATNCHHPRSWLLPGTSPTIKELIPSHRKLFFKKVTVYSSLRTSLDYESDGSIKEDPELASSVCLPFVIRSATKVSRCCWNGEYLKLVSVDGSASSFNFNSDNGFHEIFKICSSVVRDFFIPRQVTENYMDYVKWKFLHRVFSSSLQVLATQAMFRAIGIGYSSSLPSAAALNWVLKDGLGRLSRCIYTACLASAFDTNLKRVRFSTSVLFSASIGVELLTPVFPQSFLLLATIANVAKQISLACYLATRSAVHRTFAIADNLGEVSAKAQIQTVCFDNLGFMLAALLNMWFGNHDKLRAGFHFFVYPIFTAMDLLGTYQGLKHIHLQTLTKDRLEIVLNTWIVSQYVPSPAEVSEKEGINFLGDRGKHLWPIRIGCLNSKNQIPKWSMMTMKCVTGKDRYFICTEIFSKGFKRTQQHGILVCLHEGAEAMDIIMGLLQACYIRQTLLISCSNNKWEYSFRERNSSDLILKEWSAIIEQSKRSAKRTSSKLIEQMLAMGWTVKSILLTAQEQVRYSFVND